MSDLESQFISEDHEVERNHTIIDMEGSEPIKDLDAEMPEVEGNEEHQPMDHPGRSSRDVKTSPQELISGSRSRSKRANRRPRHSDDMVEKQGTAKPLQIFTGSMDDLKAAVLDAWNTKSYSDVAVICSGGEIVQAHRLLLASLSPFLLRALAVAEESGIDETVLLLPDVDSSVFKSFMENVCSGDGEDANVHPSLSYLEFGLFRFRSDSKSSKNETFIIKPDPDAFDLDGDEDELRQEADEEMDDEDIEIKPRDKQKRKKRSLTWKYFDRIDNTLASCKTCQVTVRTVKGNTTGMAAHLRSAHSDLFSDLKNLRKPQEEENQIEDVEIKKQEPEEMRTIDEGAPIRRKKRSLVWQYFQQQDSTSARCTSCSAIVKTEMGNTTGMANHLRGNHPELFKAMQRSKKVTETKSLPIIPEVEADPIEEEPLDEEISKSSPVWQFFEVDDDDEGFVRCVECDQPVQKEPGTTKTLLHHLIRCHEDLYSNCIKDKLENPDLPDPGDPAHPIWRFFDNVPLDADKPNPENNGTAQCRLCAGSFPFPETDVEPLEEHLRSEHDTCIEDYETYCSEWRDQRHEEAQLVRLIDSSRRIGIHRATRSAIWNYFDQTDEKTRNICKTCGKTLTCMQQNTTNMIRHLECNHHELYTQFLVDSGSVEASTKTSEERSKRRRGPKPTYSDDPVHRTCPDCNKVYSCRPAMLYHRKTVHSGVRPYKCNECGMTFSRPDSFRGHTHNKVRSYLCSHCGKTFARKNIRDQHERAHRGDKRYPCTFCGKMFMTNQQRANHERTHTGEKPFQCTDCGRQFAQQHQLTTHMRIHTGDKPYNCPTCGQKFRHLSSRNNHKCETRTGAGPHLTTVSVATTTSIRWSEQTQPMMHEVQHLMTE